METIICTPPSESPVQTAIIPIGQYNPQLIQQANIKCLKIEKYEGLTVGMNSKPNYYSIKFTFFEMVDTEMKEKEGTAPVVISLGDLPLLIDTLKLFTMPL